MTEPRTITDTLAKIHEDNPPRDPARIPKLIEELQALWEAYPDYRFGQMIVNIAHTGVARMYSMEDDAWMRRIRAHRKMLQEVDAATPRREAPDAAEG